jgi:type VI secretion system protein ImpA
MSTVDIDALLLEIDTATSCGPNLEGEQAFLALENEARGKPEVQYGATITPALPPDWKIVRSMAKELLGRSRDLRLAVYLLRANLALNGIAGMVDSLVLIERLLDARWDGVYPLLDAEENNDPTERISCLANLCDAETLVRELKDATLLTLPGLGPLTIKLLEIAYGESQPAPGREKIEPASIERAIADIDRAKLAAVVDALGRALGAVVNIEAMLVRRVGSAKALNFDALTRPLRKAHEFLARQQGQAAGASAEAGEGAPPAGTAAVAVAADAVPQAGPLVGQADGAGEIRSRADVVSTLDRLIHYYFQHEPSSPIPILLARAKRLVPMSFFELMQDLAPEGIAQLAVIRGPDGAKNDNDD